MPNDAVFCIVPYVSLHTVSLVPEHNDLMPGSFQSWQNTLVLQTRSSPACMQVHLPSCALPRHMQSCNVLQLASASHSTFGNVSCNVGTRMSIRINLLGAFAPGRVPDEWEPDSEDAPSVQEVKKKVSELFPNSTPFPADQTCTYLKVPLDTACICSLLYYVIHETVSCGFFWRVYGLSQMLLMCCSNSQQLPEYFGRCQGCLQAQSWA